LGAAGAGADLSRRRASVDAPWSTVTYADALQQVRVAAAWILAQG
jgi:feruloyl-CoA synthase